MKEMNKWTMKETLKGKTFSIIILTIILTIAINKLVNRIMTQEVIFEGGYTLLIQTISHLVSMV